MQYNKILYITHHIIKDTGNVFEYFLKNTANFYLYAFSPTFQNNPCIFIEYKNGQKIKETKFYWYKGKSVILKYFFYYLYFFDVVLFKLPRNVLIINNHPLFCILNSLIKMIRKSVVVFWIFDYFPSQKGLYFFYNKLVDYYNQNLKYVLYLGPGVKDQYDKKVSKKNAYRQNVLFAIKKIDYERKPLDNLLGFVGNLKDYQGIELIFNTLKLDQSLSLEIMGDGIKKDEFKKLAKNLGVDNRVKFLGFIPEEQVADMITRWQIGLAPYQLCEENCTHYAEPGKIKFYLQYGLPVIMTQITYIYDEIKQNQAGIIIENKPDQLLAAINKIQNNYQAYLDEVKKTSKNYPYPQYYDKSFEFLNEIKF